MEPYESRGFTHGFYEARGGLPGATHRNIYVRKPTSWTAGDDECHALPYATAQAQGKRGKSAVATVTFGIQLQLQQGTEAAHSAEGFVALQAEKSGNVTQRTRESA